MRQPPAYLRLTRAKDLIEAELTLVEVEVTEADELIVSDLRCSPSRQYVCSGKGVLYFRGGDSAPEHLPRLRHWSAASQVLAAEVMTRLSSPNFLFLEHT